MIDNHRKKLKTLWNLFLISLVSIEVLYGIIFIIFQINSL